VPFFRSRPSRPLLIGSLSTATVGALLPLSPFAHVLGFGPLSPAFYLALLVMVVAYLTLVELIKRRFFYGGLGLHPLAGPRRVHERRIQRRASRWSRAV